MWKLHNFWRKWRKHQWIDLSQIWLIKFIWTSYVAHANPQYFGNVQPAILSSHLPPPSPRDLVQLGYHSESQPVRVCCPWRMPSANPKLEKQASTETVDPLRQAIVVIEHKIRNLEKRKVNATSRPNHNYRQMSICQSWLSRRDPPWSFDMPCARASIFQGYMQRVMSTYRRIEYQSAILYNVWSNK